MRLLAWRGFILFLFFPDTRLCQAENLAVGALVLGTPQEPPEDGSGQAACLQLTDHPDAVRLKLLVCSLAAWGPYRPTSNMVLILAMGLAASSLSFRASKRGLCRRMGRRRGRKKLASFCAFFSSAFCFFSLLTVIWYKIASHILVALDLNGLMSRLMTS